jgi:hypothetical protein
MGSVKHSVMYVGRSTRKLSFYCFGCQREFEVEVPLCPDCKTRMQLSVLTLSPLAFRCTTCNKVHIETKRPGIMMPKGAFSTTIGAVKRAGTSIVKGLGNLYAPVASTSSLPACRSTRPPLRGSYSAPSSWWEEQYEDGSWFKAVPEEPIEESMKRMYRLQEEI